MAPSSQHQTRSGRLIHLPARYASQGGERRDEGQSAELDRALERRRRAVEVEAHNEPGRATQAQAVLQQTENQEGGGRGGVEEHGHQEVAGVGRERVNLEDWLDPVVPGPHPGPIEEDAIGWNRIDALGVWDCMLCPFPTMADIPGSYRHIWASSMAKVLQAIRESEGGLNLERALKWFLILPQALFRQGRRGGKAGKGLVGQRINCLVRNDWGGLLILLEKDIEAAKSESGRRRAQAVSREEGERW